MTGLSAILFGLKDVLFHFSPEQRWENFAGICDLPAEEIRRRLADSGFTEACERGRLRGERALVECGRLLDTRLSMDRFQTLWVGCFDPNLEVIQLVQLARRKAASALLSNNSDITRVGLEATYPDELGLFLPRLFSGDLGVMKPDPRSFAAALSLLDLPADQCLFVDAMAHHTAAAASLGFHTHRFENPVGLRNAMDEFGLLS